MTGTLGGMDPYSMDLRKRVLAACDAGKGTSAVAALFSVSPAWVRRLKQHRRERGGDVAPRTGGGARASRTKIDRGRLADLVTAQPDATLAELRDRLGVDVTPWAVGLALRALGITYKKSRSARPSRTARTSPRSARRGA
jgi:transposase